MHTKQDKMHMKHGESSLHNIPNDLSQRHEDRRGRKEVSLYFSLRSQRLGVLGENSSLNF